MNNKENGQASLPPHIFRDTLTLTREDFDNPEVHNASNPHPVFGYTHGPIPDNNPYWLPQVVIDALNAGRSRPDVKVGDIQHAPNPPANPMVIVNRVNGLVCDILLPHSSVMCGRSCEAPNSLRRHQRKFHPGAVIPAVRTYTHTYAEEKAAAENGLKKWVLYGGWRNAHYLHEPGRGPTSSPINGWCEALERIALQDSDFRDRFGSAFHRRTVVPLMDAPETPGTQDTSAMEET